MSLHVNKIRCADALVKILENSNVKFIFGHPGEQILPFYDALKDSSIKHILMRHEQGAAHAADGYARTSFNPGVCVATAGPGALNLVMGVATAFKDSVPMIVITGDVPRELKGKNVFQDLDLNNIFKNITLESFYVDSPEDGVLKLKYAFELFNHGRTGPIHLNFPKDVLDELLDMHNLDVTIGCSQTTPLKGVEDAINLIENSKKPLILAGSGIIWGHAIEELRNFTIKNSIPIVTTYSARGVIPEDNPLCLGMIGLRGTTAANIAGKNCDLLIALGCRFSERTSLGIGKTDIIHVNSDYTVLHGKIKIQGDAGEFLDKVKDINTKNTEEWLNDLESHKRTYKIKTNYDDVPIKPQRAIKEIIDASNHLTTISDAGTHTTWVNLLKRIIKPSEMIFSGGFGPMGYGIPAAIGASIAKPKEKIILIVGDGGFQMTEQELAVISQEQMEILICIIDNSCLGIIKQWQEMNYRESFEVDLENPDFIELAKAYNINGKLVITPDEVFGTVKNALKIKGPYIIDIRVDKEEGIILPKKILP